MRLEVVMIPVSDVDLAKAFYERAGFHLDVDHQPDEGFRVVQLTPPGSACSITLGVGLGLSQPGTVKGTHLVVRDVVEACAELEDRGIEVDAVRHMGADGWQDGPHPDRADYATYSGFSDPDGNTWLVQEVGHHGVD